MPYSLFLYIFRKFKKKTFLKIGPGSLPLLSLPTMKLFQRGWGLAEQMRVMLPRLHSN